MYKRQKKFLSFGLWVIIVLFTLIDEYCTWVAFSGYPQVQTCKSFGLSLWAAMSFVNFPVRLVQTLFHSNSLRWFWIILEVLWIWIFVDVIVHANDLFKKRKIDN